MGIQVPDTNPFGGGYGPAPGAAPPSPAKVTEYGDLMVAYSTTPGFVSWRDSTNGSWFIQDLCEVNNKHFICDYALNTVIFQLGVHEQLPQHSSLQDVEDC